MVLASREASETFIAREIEALQKRKLPLVVVTLGELSGGAGLPPCNITQKHAGLEPCTPRIFEELRAFSPRNALRIWRHRRETEALVAKAREVGATRLHAQFAWVAADVVGMAAETLQIPWACSVHAWDVFTRPTAELRRRLRGAEFVIACNERARDAVAKAVTCPVHLVRHGVRSQQLAVPEERSTKKIIAIGRLVPKKGFDTLLVAMSKLCHEGVECVVVGDGPERGKLMRLATRLGIAKQVWFARQLSHAATMKELGTSTLLALPSRRTRDGDSDGFANVLIEAMQYGVPIVTTTAAGAGELLTNGFNAMLVPPDAPVLLAAAMDRVFADSRLRRLLARRARRVLGKHFNQHTEIAKTANLIFGNFASQKSTLENSKNLG